MSEILPFNCNSAAVRIRVAITDRRSTLITPNDPSNIKERKKELGEIAILLSKHWTTHEPFVERKNNKEASFAQWSMIFEDPRSPTLLRSMVAPAQIAASTVHKLNDKSLSFYWFVGTPKKRQSAAFLVSAFPQAQSNAVLPCRIVHTILTLSDR